MLIDLNNLRSNMKLELRRMKCSEDILGFRVICGPWDETYIFDIETKEENLSGLLLDTSNGLELAGPFKITKKEVKNESKKSA